MHEIFTAGYPRSGNTWLGRMLCDLFNAPLQNTLDMEPIWDFTETPKEYSVVRKTHWYAHEYHGKGLLPNSTCSVVWIVRDPRDMAVSIMHYRKVTDLMQVILSIDNPGQNDAGIHKMVFGWMMRQEKGVISATYEGLHNYSRLVLAKIYGEITGSPADMQKLDKVIQRHKFNNWAPQYPHSMRKGIVGDWKNYFTHEHAIVFRDKYQDILEILGYEEDGNWAEKWQITN